MNITPTLKEVQNIAAKGLYQILPVSCEILSDFTTPLETMKILKQVSTHCYLLESATVFWDMTPSWKSPAGTGT